MATGTPKVQSDRAARATADANKSPSKEAHLNASSEHMNASSIHSQSGNAKEAEAHRSAAQNHAANAILSPSAPATTAQGVSERARDDHGRFA